MKKYFLELISLRSFLRSRFNYYCTGTSTFKPILIPGLMGNTRMSNPRVPMKRRRPRYKDMKGDEDWTNIWPAASSFNYNIVPLPVRQGFVKNSTENDNIIPEKYGNLELMKIPNFLHLTPSHIEKHCTVLKKYCTKWPDELNDSNAKYHFPLEFTQTDYIHSAPSIRDIRARVVTLKFNLDRLSLNERERFKFIKLLGEKRYDKESNTVTIVADRCPSNKQNYDYLKYVFTALITESKKFEKWELEEEESDWLKFKWNQSRFKTNADSFLEKAKFENIPNAKNIEKKLEKSVEALFNEKETIDLLNDYKNSVLELLQLKKEEPVKI